MSNPTTRFSNRVENYIKFRPNYPNELYAALAEKCSMSSDSLVADIGSGTGILTEGLLDRAKRVFAIEPNMEMRKAAENALSSRNGFVSVDATAENTSLGDGAIDLIVAGQAFHWFDRSKCRLEFERILAPDGYLALAWNERLLDTSDFLVEYEAFLKSFATDYEKVNHMNIDASVIASFFNPAPVELQVFENIQRLDFESLLGRVASSSYMPSEKSAVFPAMREALRNLFDRRQMDGYVMLEYASKLYYGQLNKFF